MIGTSYLYHNAFIFVQRYLCRKIEPWLLRVGFFVVVFKLLQAQVWWPGITWMSGLQAAERSQAGQMFAVTKPGSENWLFAYIGHWACNSKLCFIPLYGCVLWRLLLTASSKSGPLGVDHPPTPTSFLKPGGTGRHNAATCRRGCWSALPYLVLLCYGVCVYPLLWAWSQLFLSFPLSDSPCAKSKVKAH